MTTKTERTLDALLDLLNSIQGDVREIDDVLDHDLGDIGGWTVLNWDDENVREDVDEVIDALREAAAYAQGIARQCQTAIKRASEFRKTLKSARQMNLVK